VLVNSVKARVVYLARRAPVSTRLRRDKASEARDPKSFIVEVVLERVRRHGASSRGVLTTKQRLTDALRAFG